MGNFRFELGEAFNLLERVGTEGNAPYVVGHFVHAGLAPSVRRNSRWTGPTSMPAPIRLRIGVGTSDFVASMISSHGTNY